MANPFDGHEMPSPDVPVAVLARELEARYGLVGALRPLGSHQDQNLLFRADDGRRLLVKVANAAYPAEELAAQDAAMLHVAAKGLPFATPVPVAAADGAPTFAVEDASGRCIARVLSWVEGTPLHEAGYLSPPVRVAFGEVAGSLATALADLEHPGADRVIQWDCRQAHHVVEALGGALPAHPRRDRARVVAAAAHARLGELVPSLRNQVIHGDLTTYNMVARRDAAGRLVPVGVIDFGDLVSSYLAGELAVALTGLVVHVPEAALEVACDIASGFHATCPLGDAELAALWPLVRLRATASAVSGDHQLATDPSNAYVRDSVELEWDAFAAIDAIPDGLAEEAIRAALGLGPSLAARAAALSVHEERPVPAVPVDRPVVVDLGVAMDGVAPGRWADAAALAALVEGARAAGAPVGRHAEGRLVHARADVREAPATVHLGADVFAPAGTPVAAPLAGRVARRAERALVLACDGLDVHLRGVEPAVEEGAAVAAGDVVGRIAEAPAGALLPAHLHVQAAVPGADPPPLATPAEAAGWRALSPDPSPLLGLAPGTLVAPEDDPEALLARRDAVLASVQERYYARGPRIERGLGHHLHALDGRVYLDVVNNVAAVGHSHPRVAEAVGRQLRLLNTNSRFNYRLIVEYAERLAALLPPALDTVFLVSTGSEAVDLALRVARIATGRRDVLAVRSAYHGWTGATDEISTSIVDNPRALETRPPWVHVVDSPNAYRGAHRGPDAGARYADDVRATLERLAASGGAPAAFIAEPLYGNAGGVELPAGYLAEAYRLVRAAGGLAIADEVQVGLGRTGEAVWAFEREGVEPDVVTIAKAAGNGVALGAVITRRELADRFRDEGSFFSSRGRLARLVRRRHRRPRRAARRGPPGERARRRRAPEGAPRGARRPPPARRRGARRRPLPRPRARARPGDARAGTRGDACDLRPPARARDRRAADERRLQRAQDQAADVPHAGERRLLRRRARPRADDRLVAPTARRRTPRRSDRGRPPSARRSPRGSGAGPRPSPSRRSRRARPGRAR